MPARRSLPGTAAVMVVLALPGAMAAGAVMVTSDHAGAWEALDGHDASGRPACAMAATDPADAMRLTITAAAGDDGFAFRVSKPTWAIPRGTGVTVLVRIGRGTAQAFRASGAATTLDWHLDGADAAAFHARFRRSGTMTLRFPDGTEPPWRVPLAGSADVDRAFVRCVRDLVREAAGPTQPFGRPPTQPMIQAQPLAPPPGTAPGATAPDGGNTGTP